jgi:hypothetical protein
MPERNEFVDGVIPKARGTADCPERHSALVDFVAHPALALLSENNDRKLLQAAFPYLHAVND